MEINPSEIEKTNQTKWSFYDQDDYGLARSYTCTFCKRGFSNAQALGGHMNIHRRDRAKLKQSSVENLVSLNMIIPDNPSDKVWERTLEDKRLLKFEICEKRNSPTEEYRRRPLFAETTSMATIDLTEERKMELIHASICETKLDLELRLGSHQLKRHRPC